MKLLEVIKVISENIHESTCNGVLFNPFLVTGLLLYPLNELNKAAALDLQVVPYLTKDLLLWNVYYQSLVPKLKCLTN